MITPDLSDKNSMAGKILFFLFAYLLGFIVNTARSEECKFLLMSDEKIQKQASEDLVKLLKRYERRVSDKSRADIEAFIIRADKLLSYSKKTGGYEYETFYISGGQVGARIRKKPNKPIEFEIGVVEFDPEVEFGENIQSGVFMINLYFAALEWVSRLKRKNPEAKTVIWGANDLMNKTLIENLKKLGFRKNFWFWENKYTLRFRLD